MPLSHARTSTTSEHLLDRYEDVAELAEQIRADGEMGLDTEFISEGSYQPVLALLQVSTRDDTFLIDPLAEHIQMAPDQPIWDAMADPKVRTIVHAHDQESLFCLQRTGNMPGDLFDVQLAAAFCGYHYPIAYDKLVARELHHRVGPSQSRTNWFQRPLTSAQRRYAAEDVRWLLQLHDRFSGRMSRGSERLRMDWLREETDDRLQRLQHRDDNRWRRLAGSNKLSPRSLAALREVSAWRDSVARERDIPFRHVASDQLLVSIAAVRPTTRDELASVRGINQLKHASFSQVLGAIERAHTLDEDELPARAMRSRGTKPSRMVVLFLESVLAAACAQHEVDPELLGSSAQLRELLAWNQRGRPTNEQPRLISGWRGEVCAQPLLDALEGRITLRISDPLAGHPLSVAGLPTAT